MCAGRRAVSAAAVIGLGFTSMPLHCVAVLCNLPENGTYFCSPLKKDRDESDRQAGRGGSHVASKAGTKRLPLVVAHLQSLKMHKYALCRWFPLFPPQSLLGFVGEEFPTRAHSLSSPL